MSYPVVRAIGANQSQQLFYAAQGQNMPSEVYRVRVSAEVFNTNCPYWLQKGNGEPLQPVRCDRVGRQFVTLEIAQELIDLDGSIDNGWRLWQGDSGEQQLVTQSPNVNRWDVQFSLQ